MSKTIRVANGDWYFDSRGRSAYIEEREKCAQDAACVQLQDLYDDGSWGCELNRVERGTIVDSLNAHKALIQALVTEAMERLQAFQEQEEDIPNTEKVQDFSVTVERMPNQPLAYVYFLSIKTVGYKEPLKQTYVVQLQQTADPNILDLNLVE